MREAVTTICGTRAGADMDDGLRINGIRQNCQYVFKPNFSAAGAAFFDGVTSADPAVLEAAQWINAVVNDGTPCVLPEQAFTVTRIWRVSTPPPKRETSSAFKALPRNSDGAIAQSDFRQTIQKFAGCSRATDKNFCEV